jgi:hypothetical protein
MLALFLGFYNPASGGPVISLPGSGAVPAPGPQSAPQSAPLAGGEQAIVAKVKPGLVIINTTLQYNSETAAGTGMVINARPSPPAKAEGRPAPRRCTE